MKQKFLLTAAFIALMTINSFAQHSESYLSAALPLVTEDGISEITVSDNIDVLLIQDNPENVKVKASADDISNLKVSVVDGKLFLAGAKGLKKDQRLAVYIWVNDLESLTLKGNAFVTSRGILRNKNLHISAGKEARVLLKADGKVWFNSPSHYEIEQRNGYSFIQL